MTMTENEFEDRLRNGLEIFVPWRLFELQNHSIDQIQWIADHLKLNFIYSKEHPFPQWDSFLYAKGKGEFMHLVEILAILSYCPGGVHAFGLHFESTTKDGKTL